MLSIWEKKQVLDGYPVDKLLEIGLPHMKFFCIRGQYHALCPFHKDTSLGNFSYNPAKDVWKCFVCGEGGSGPYSLIERVNGWSFKETIHYLYENRKTGTSGFGGTAPAFRHKKGNNPSARTSAHGTFFYQSEVPAEELDRIYSCFAQCSPLYPSDAEKLCAKRGLRQESTRHFFRFPSFDDDDFWCQFRSALGEERYHHLLGVPGFFWDERKKEPQFIGEKNALGILNHRPDGKINGIELRLRSNQAMRYMPFSSDGICARNPNRFSCGANLGSIVDVVYPEPPAPRKEIAVTEGKFKALHLSYLGYTVLNIHGVSNWRKVLPVLSELNVHRVTIVFDADSRTNPPVAAHALALGQALQQDYDTYYLAWPAAIGKGVDDAINHGGKDKLKCVPAEKFMQKVLTPFVEQARQNQALYQMRQRSGMTV